MTTSKLSKFTVVHHIRDSVEVLHLLGVVFNDNRHVAGLDMFSDGHIIYTTPVVERYADLGVCYAKTESGTIYELGLELSNSEFHSLDCHNRGYLAIPDLLNVFHVH